jgi:CheY-like chemotaxis protein
VDPRRIGGNFVFRRVKILIRDIGRNLYLAQGGQWVATIAEARSFALGTAAIEHIKRNSLTGVDLYCVFRNITFNTAIPVTAYEETISDLQKPIVKSPAGTTSNAVQAMPTKLRAVRVLLVEDDADDVYLLNKMLRSELSCEVTVAFTKEVYETELERRPDLIVSDSNVRAFDGITALVLARKMYPDIPFVFCSGSTSPEKRETAMALGASAWASKENCFRELVQVVLRLLERKD